MRQSLLMSLAVACLAIPPAAEAQRASQRGIPTRPAATQAVGEDDRPRALPLDHIPFERRTQRLLSDVLDADTTPADSLTESQVLERLSRIYDYQARILAAQARGDLDLAEDLLELAMTEIGTLARAEFMMERPRFRETYRSVVTEYERFYGVSADTLTLQFGEVFEVRADMFAALNDVNEPLLEDVSMPVVRTPVATVVPMTMNRLVEQSIAFLLRSPDRHLYHWLSRAETYFPMIEQILEEEGVPDELKYLAMIESGLNPRARSWAQAGGMWQFITATGRAYGLEVNGYVDERLDPEKATRAAARHLKDLHQMFGGDWQLALAGYNCSPARVKRAIARAEARLDRPATFWDIYDDIPKETRNYVPMFIAAALVASNPDAYDLDLTRVRPGPEYAYHYVPVRGMLSLSEIARMADTDVNTIKALNPELRRSTLPPSKGAYHVRIPLGTYESFAAAYAELPAEARRTSVAEHVVARGEALGTIARRYDVSVSAIMRSNDLDGTTIHPGQRLIIPVPSYESSAAIAGMDNERVQAMTVDYGERLIRPIFVADGETPTVRKRTTPQTASAPVVRASLASAPARSSSREEEAPAAEERNERSSERSVEKSESRDTRIVYRVRSGDTLAEIAQRYGVSISDIRGWNKIRGSRIMVGQRLYLYESNEKGTVATASSSSERVVYRVKRGDNLTEIARRYGVSVNDIRRWNDLRSDNIHSGQRLTIHGGGGERSSAPSVVSYKVRRGDTLAEIAKRYGVSIKDLKSWNKLRSDVIRPGQKLKIRS